MHGVTQSPALQWYVSCGWLLWTLESCCFLRNLSCLRRWSSSFVGDSLAAIAAEVGWMSDRRAVLGVVSCGCHPNHGIHGGFVTDED